MIQPESVCLLIADISGYTEYLSTVEIDHAQDILADLVGTVVTSLKPGFRLAKLEGDAAFCFAPAEKIDGSQLLDTIEHCYFSFRRRRRDVRQATSCECNACTRIPNLNLKFVAHHGVALRQKMAGREELLGSDVIVVHRLLKNDIVEKMGIPAYVALTDQLVQTMGIDPAQLDMHERTETYEHIGDVKIWVHDLERRWQQEEQRQRVFVGAEKALFTNVTTVDAPPQVVWEFLTKPGGRMQWQFAGGTTGIDEQPASGNRRGVGTVNHCMHGPDAIIENVLDWRPFDYFTTRSQLPHGGPAFVSTFEFEPTATGTNVIYRVETPKKAADREAMAGLEGLFAESFGKGLAVLKGVARDEVGHLNADRVEPDLPELKNADGFLQGMPPLEYVG
ncbi:MAG TPA: DUF2652 domain-containing protein [Candidatus Limnocylindrales bacterium]